MDHHHITTGKIAASPTDTTWAQAYSAGKLYTVLSLEGTADTSLASIGKETIEKLQREFFALDEKSLASIKKSVEVVYEALPTEISSSLVLATVVEDALYIVIANSGNVVLKRQDTVSVIAQGEKDSVSTFSGKFEPLDEFILTTSGFLKTVSIENIQKSLENTNPHEAAESLALIIHENSTGLEAGLVLSFGKQTVAAAAAENTPKHTDEVTKEEIENNDHLELDGQETPSEEHKKRALPTFQIGSLTSFIPKKLSRKQLIIGGVIILLLILGGGILFENRQRQDGKYNEQADAIISQNSQKYDDALAVQNLNKSLADEELQEIKSDLEKEQKNFPQGSDARLKIDAFLAKVTSALGGQGNSNISVFFDTKGSDLHSVLYISNKGEDMAAAGTTQAALITNGSAKDTTQVKSTKGISSNEKSIFILTSSGVQKISKDTHKVEDLFDVENPKSMDTFGDNVYVLEDKAINKYRPNAYTKESYFTKDTTLINPSSIAIDSSIYIVDDGKIRKFTRGAEDTFNYNGPKLSSSSLAYTDEDYANLYVVDPSSKMAYVIDKSGNKVKELNLKGMKSITGVSASEKDKKMYVAGDNKVYAINL